MLASPRLRVPSLRPTLPVVRRSLDPIALVLVAVAVAGLTLAVVGPFVAPGSSVTPTPLTLAPEAGDLPIIGDPIRDLTIWFSNRLSDANRAGVDSLRGRFLTPIDPLADPLSRDLYGKILILVVPLLTAGGIVLGYLLMTARTSGEGAYTVRAITPRFVIGAVLAILGIFLVSVLAQFVATTDVALVEVSVGSSAVGGTADWPAAGGPFLVLQRAGYDPRIGEGPGLWNTGAWLSAGFLSGILLTVLGMLNAMLTGIERLLITIAPICLAAYALPATQRIANLWLKVLGAVLAVRFAWSLLFVFFSLQAVEHVDASGAPIAAGDVRTMLGIAVGAAGLMIAVALVMVPLALLSPGPLRTER